MMTDATPAPPAAIRAEALTENEQFAEAVELQKTIWGFDDVELLPVRLFSVATKVGGQAFGAYDGDRMIAYCLAIPGLKTGGKVYLHSHMLGVLPEYRDRGIGRLLKLKQRDDALERGIELIEWTFDPLEFKNAYFNLERLGAIVRRYVRNQYGITNSPLHGGLPTDRCVAEWWVGSERVRQVLEGAYRRPPVLGRVELPADVAMMRRHHPKRARVVQDDAGRLFESAFARGLAVIGFEQNESGAAYLVGESPL
jgi:predicted GNAT superfamily acetyltransferase